MILGIYNKAFHFSWGKIRCILIQIPCSQTQALLEPLQSHPTQGEALGTGEWIESNNFNPLDGPGQLTDPKDSGSFAS